MAIEMLAVLSNGMHTNLLFEMKQLRDEIKTAKHLERKFKLLLMDKNRL